MREATKRPPRFGCSCGRKWDGLAECHCAGGPGDPGCHLHFLSVAGFDQHRVAMRCYTLDELRERPSKKAALGVQRMYETTRMHGPVWVTALRPTKEAPDEFVERWRAGDG